MVAKALTMVALLGMLHWMFGNLYEAVVFSPNWIVDSKVQLERMHGLFVRTSPTAYFVPTSFLAPILAWVAHGLHRDPSATHDFRRASLWALLVTALNAFIVATIITVLFADDYHTRPDVELYDLCVRWNVLNGFRMLLSAAVSFHLFAAFRKMDRPGVPVRLPPR